MTSSAQRDALRDAADFDNDRKDGRYAPGGDRAWWRMEREPLDLDAQAAIDRAMAQIERAFRPSAKSLRQEGGL